MSRSGPPLRFRVQGFRVQGLGFRVYRGDIGIYRDSNDRTYGV